MLFFQKGHLCVREAEALRRRQENESRKQHGCEAELRRESADHPEDGPADATEATESQDHGEDEGGVPPRRDPPDPDPDCRYVK